MLLRIMHISNGVFSHEHFCALIERKGCEYYPFVFLVVLQVSSLSVGLRSGWIRLLVLPVADSRWRKSPGNRFIFLRPPEHVKPEGCVLLSEYLNRHVILIFNCFSL